MGVALLWLLRGKSGPAWCVLSWSTLSRSGWSSRWCRLCLGPPVSHESCWKNFIFCVACLVTPFTLGNLYFAFALVSFGSHVGIWTLLLQVLHPWQFAAVFAAQCSWGPSMMKSSSSSRAPRKLVLSDSLQRWSFVDMHISHLNRP